MKAKKLSLALLAMGMGAGLLGSAQAADLQTLEKQLQQLQKEIAELKAAAATKKEVADLNDQVVLQGKESVVAGDIPNSFRMPGSDTSLRIYGYVETNAIHDMKGTASGDFGTAMASQPLNTSPHREGGDSFNAGNTRFGFETSTPTAHGPLHTVIEGHFYNSGSGASNFRLRHAYGEYAGWLVGQTWSTFMDGDNTPETVDFNGPVGTPFNRSPMVRYTYDMPSVVKLTAAIEGAELNGSTVPGNSTDLVSQSPRLVLRADKAFDWGTLNLRVASHKEQASTTGESAQAVSWGIGGSFKLTEDLTFFGQYNQVQQDINGGLMVGANTPKVVNGVLTLDRSKGTVLGLTNVFNPQWRATVAYSTMESGLNASDAYVTNNADVNSKLVQWHINAFYTPIKNVDLGAELIGGRRETFLSGSGDMGRVNLLARYTFN